MYTTCEKIKKDREIASFTTNKPIAWKGDYFMICGKDEPNIPLTLKDTVIHPEGLNGSTLKLKYFAFDEDALLKFCFGKPFSEDKWDTAKTVLTLTRSYAELGGKKLDLTLGKDGVIDITVNENTLSVCGIAFSVNINELNGYMELKGEGGSFGITEIYAETEKVPLSEEMHSKLFEDWCMKELDKFDDLVDRLEEHIKNTPDCLPDKKGEIIIEKRLVDVGDEAEVKILCSTNNAAMVITHDCFGSTPITETVPLGIVSEGDGFEKTITVKFHTAGNTKIELWAEGERIVRQVAVLDKGYMAVIPWIGSNTYLIDEEWHRFDISGDYWAENLRNCTSPEEAIKRMLPFIKRCHKYGDRPVCFVNEIVKNRRKGSLFDFSSTVQKRGLNQIGRIMKVLGFGDIELIASYTPDSVALGILEEMGVKGLTSLCAWQNCLDGGWKINHCGVPNQPYYPADDDFRRSGENRKIMGFTMGNASFDRNYSLFVYDSCPSNVLPGQRYTHTKSVHHGLQVFYDFFDGYIEDQKRNDNTLFVTVPLESFRGSMDWNCANDLAVRYMVNKARSEKLVFTSAADIADYHIRKDLKMQSVYFFQTDCYYGQHNAEMPGNVGDRIEADTPEYLAVVRKGEMLPLYFYDYTTPWQNDGFEDIERNAYGLVNPDTHTPEECTPKQVKRSDIKMSYSVSGNEITIFVECEQDKPRMVTALFDLPFSPDCEIFSLKSDVFVKKIKDHRNGNLYIFIDLGKLASGKSEIVLKVNGDRREPETAEWILKDIAAMWMGSNGRFRSARVDGSAEVLLSVPDTAYIQYFDGNRVKPQNGKLKFSVHTYWFDEAPMLFGVTKDEFEKAIATAKTKSLGKTHCSRWF